MNRSIISKVFASLVILVAIAVMIGWFLDIAILKSIIPVWVSMKFITAFSFLLSGILVFILSNGKKGESSKFFILITSFTIFLLMMTFLISLFSGVGTGIESLFIKDAAGAVRTSAPGVPAIPTIICFILISIIGLLFTSNPGFSKIPLIISTLITAIGSLAVIGYLINAPFLYYSFPGYTSMAFHTAILFVLIGISTIVLKKGDNKE